MEENTLNLQQVYLEYADPNHDPNILYALESISRPEYYNDFLNNIWKRLHNALKGDQLYKTLTTDEKYKNLTDEQKARYYLSRFSNTFPRTLLYNWDQISAIHNFRSTPVSYKPVNVRNYYNNDLTHMNNGGKIDYFKFFK